MNTTTRRLARVLATTLLAAAPTVAWASVDLPGPGPLAMAGAAGGAAVPAMHLAMGSPLPATPLLVHPGIVATVLLLALAVMAGAELGHLMRAFPHRARVPRGAR
ncbi:MAG: hypothetical protein ACKOCT_16150 [Alphaproteobacteria bacterium]